MIIPIERQENIGSFASKKAVNNNFLIYEITYLNEEKSERHLFEKDLSLFILLIIYGLS